MHPFHKALHKKKMEGLMISIHPMGDESKEDMKQAAARGDQAPEVLDKHESSEGLDADPAVIPDVSEHDANDVQEPHAEHPKKYKKPTSLREKAEAVMKKKGF